MWAFPVSGLDTRPATRTKLKVQRNMNLDGSRVLVTGASAGIGYAIAERLQTRGARVVINGRDVERLASAGERLGLHPVAGDVSADADSIVSQAIKKLGGLDTLINNAGWGQRMPLATLDAEVYEAMWRTNVLGAALMAQACLPHLKSAAGGNIVNIASTAARRGYAEGSAYCSTKFALRGMTECWQAELRPENIRVMLVNPSEVQTGFGGRDPERAKNPHKLFSEEVAHAVVSALEMHPRGFIPELTIHATNPWRES